MTLFSGYSMIPSAPASKRLGMMSRTVLSSTITSIATHSSSSRLDKVGLLSAGTAIFEFLFNPCACCCHLGWIGFPY